MVHSYPFFEWQQPDGLAERLSLAGTSALQSSPVDAGNAIPDATRAPLVLVPVATRTYTGVIAKIAPCHYNPLSRVN